MGIDAASDKVAQSMSRLLAMSSGCEAKPFLRASDTVRKTPHYDIMANLTWDKNGELDVR
jgi:hypothetical protein